MILNKKRHGCFAAVVVGLSACAEQPKVDVGYFHAAVRADLKVIQTAACTEGDNPVPSMVTSFELTPSYFAKDKASTPVPLDRLSGMFSDNGLIFNFYDDGRLKSINVTQTGQGGKIISAAAELAGKLLSPAVGVEGDAQKACKELQKISKKPVTITRSATEEFETSQKAGDIEASPPELPKGVFEKVAPIFGKVAFSYRAGPEPISVFSTKESSTSAGHMLELKLPRTLFVNAKISSQLMGIQEETKSILAPQHGKTFSLPIMRPPLFGKSGFELALNEAGIIKKLGYVTNSGAVDFLGAVNDIYDEATTTDNERLNALKLEADIIKAQQRLIACKADPSSCN